MAIKHKFVSPRANAPEDGDVHPIHWNDEHAIDGLLGALVSLAATAQTMPYLKADATGGLTALTEFMRVLLATADAPALLTAIGALAKSGGAMTGDIAMGTHRVTGLSDPASGQDAATKAYVDALATLVSGALIFKGSWDASSGAFPGATGRKTGWFYKVSVSGTVSGQAFEVGDDVYAIVDTASTSTYAANWLKIEGTVSLTEIQSAIGFTFGSLAALSSVTASLISDATANGRSLIQAANYSAMRTLLGLVIGTAAGNVVTLDVSGKLPAIDGSQLTNLPSGGSITAASISDASANGRSMLTAANYAAMLVLLGIGTAGLLDTGTTANKVVKLDGSAKLPAVDGSQLTNLASGAVTGSIAIFAFNAAPAGYLECDGSAVSRSTYSALFAALVKSSTVTMTIASPGVIAWTAHGRALNDPIRFTTTGALPTGLAINTTYYIKTIPDADHFTLSATAGGTVIATTGSQSGVHTAIHAPHGVGDGSTTFNVPNALGQFIRGWDHNAGVDASRSFGSAQLDDFKAHTHTTPTRSFTTYTGDTSNPGTDGTGGVSGSTGGTETRPKNIALLVCIKT